MLYSLIIFFVQDNVDWSAGVRTSIFHFSFGMPWQAALIARAGSAGINFAMRCLLLFLLNLRLFAVLKKRGGNYFGSIGSI